MRKTTFAKRGILGRTICLVWVLCILLGSVSVFGEGSPDRSGLVYCPLQKTWVPPSEAKPVESRAALSDICAPGKDKEKFLDRLIAHISSVRLKVSSDNESKAEDLFFSFSAKGDAAFSGIPSSPDMPKAPFAIIDKAQGTAGFAAGDHLFLTAATLSFEQLSRPPTFKASPNFPAPQIFELPSLIHATAPRGPPVLS